MTDTVQTLHLAALRDLIRWDHPGLAAEIGRVLQSGEHIVGKARGKVEF